MSDTLQLVVTCRETHLDSGIQMSEMLRLVDRCDNMNCF